jgi:hypothetical protein
MGIQINPLNAKLNPICHLLALLGAHHILHVSRIRVKLLKMRPLLGIGSSGTDYILRQCCGMERNLRPGRLFNQEEQ